MFIILLLIAAPKLRGAKLKLKQQRNEIINYGTASCCNVVYSLKFIVMKTTRPHGSCTYLPTLTTCVWGGGAGGKRWRRGGRGGVPHVALLPAEIESGTCALLTQPHPIRPRCVHLR